ncbi:MAG: ABC transporter substrate-binding protein [Chloroflexi bacterium]|nr:ABC transporter substrate-binding protein [Chloroflexota bacterium]
MRSPLARRSFLRLAGVSLAGLAGAALIGCGSDDAPSDGAKAAPPAPARSAGDAPAAALEETQLRVGYLPITDASPLLVAHGRGTFQAKGLEAPKPTLFRSWSQLAEAFQAKQVDVVHILMPMAIWLRFGQKVPLKLVAWNHTGGSALTVRPDVTAVGDLAGATVAIPFYYSIHNVVLQMLLRDAGLKPLTQGNASKADRTVKLVVMAPSDMAPALANGSIQGYIVADPFNAAAEVNKVGKVLRFVPDVWFEHACCVVVMHEADIARKPRWAQAVIDSVAEAQVYTRENRKDAAKLLSTEGQGYLPQPLPVIERALTHYDHGEYGPSGAIKHTDWKTQRIDFQPFPYRSYTEELVRALKQTLVEGDNTFLDKLDPAAAHAELIHDAFARKAIQTVGGAAKFGIDPSLSRTERIKV